MEYNNNNLYPNVQVGPVDGFEDAFGGLEELVQESADEFQHHVEQAREEFEQAWAHLAHSGLPGVAELDPVCTAILDSLESRDLFRQNWNGNHRRLLEGMRNCPAFQPILERLQD